MSRSSHAVAAMTLAVTAVPALADEIVVPDEVASLSVAVAVAADGDTITIQPGVYAQFPGISFSNKHLIIQGASGNPADVVIDGVGLDRVLTIGPNAGGTVLRGLTIANGYNDVAEANGTVEGAGLRLQADGDVIIENCIFDGNFATDDGQSRGAAMHVTATNMVVRDCIFRENVAVNDGAPGSDGGAVFVSTGTHLFERCHFENNSADSTAGALRTDSTVTQVTACTFTNNSCPIGGAIWGAYAPNQLTIDSSVFTGNDGDEGGAININATSTSFTVRNSVFRDNHAITRGGALHVNRVSRIENCTFSGNTVDGDHAVLSADAAAIPATQISNCILWGNLPAAGQVATNGGTSPLVRNCIVESGMTGSGVGVIIDADPQFLNASNGDVALAAGSPAIDAGDTSLYCGPLVDLAGNTRGVDDPVVDDLGSSIVGPVIDMGAYEIQVDEEPVETCAGDIDGDDSVSVTDLLMLLGGWGNCP